MATRKTYILDFKLDPVKLVTERGLSQSRPRPRQRYADPAQLAARARRR